VNKHSGICSYSFGLLPCLSRRPSLLSAIIYQTTSVMHLAALNTLIYKRFCPLDTPCGVWLGTQFNRRAPVLSCGTRPANKHTLHGRICTPFLSFGKLHVMGHVCKRCDPDSIARECRKTSDCTQGR